MMPMVTMMLQNMNQGQEPAFLKDIEPLMHQLAMIFAVVVENSFESEFCRGVVLAEEGKTLVMSVIPTLMQGFGGFGDLSSMSGGFASQPKQQKQQAKKQQPKVETIEEKLARLEKLDREMAGSNFLN